ncbi:MAG: GYF domain-containing protein [Thermoplasmata archaeon]|nr:GYF domain-containing protein [Thermoplasmata archaeon]
MTLGNNNSWKISDRGKVSGPYTWDQLVQKASQKELSNKATIKEESWKDWQPASIYIHPAWLYDAELNALIPNKYDAMFFGGVLLFMLAVLVTIAIPVLGIILIALSIYIELKSLQLDKIQRGKTSLGTLGNLFAGCWIGAQIFVSLLLLIFII